MRNVLVFYDTTGYVLDQREGDVREPIGVPYMWVQISEGQYVRSIDISVTPHQAILREYGAFDYESATLEEAKAYHIGLSKQNLKAYLENHPVFSTVHKPEGGYYSLTEDKQNLLLGMISVAQMKAAAGEEYQPSWNETGQACTYDWTIDQLIQLSFEIEAVVRPLVSHQQTLEAQTNACTVNTEVPAIDVSEAAYEAIA